jgi:hypothetical protein
MRLYLYRAATVQDLESETIDTYLVTCVPLEIEEERIRELFSAPFSPKSIENSVNELIAILKGDEQN